MSIFKCKMCGGTIEFEQGATVGVCDSCGTKQTLPRLDDDRRVNLYDRANHFRRNNEFDKAAGIYEQILNEDKTDAEAYWSLVLCRYGIEYVEDPATHKRVPTVNRAQFTSIFDDDNYKSALEYADTLQKGIYESEAKAINEIQKGILAISQKEEPFDVFICYKETDANGRRTPDSVLANDLYHQLTQEGFKVFFSRITLEDKLGQEYEPYIFAALNSAKVMVVLGTKPEHFNAVWVKNEWSRYLALVKQSGGRKVLIPAYKDMDPYDLPEEFSHLQAQDMSKLGFMQDLIRGIKKIATAAAPKQPVKEPTAAGSGSASVAPLLKRAFMFLEDGEWQQADEYCEKVLDQDPENAQAYLGKLMAELNVRKQESLADCAQPFDSRNNYQKAIRFGDQALTSALNGYITHINERNENARLTGIYNKGVSAMNAANTEDACRAAASIFVSIKGFRDSAALVQQCYSKAETCRKDAIYASAKVCMSRANIGGFTDAIKVFQRIPGWRDADEQIIACQKKIDELTKEAELKAEAAKKRKKLFAIAAAVIAVIVAFVIILITVIIPNSKYNDAVKLYEDGKYEEAIAAFEALDGYKDSAEQIDNCKTAIKENDYLAAVDLFNGREYEKAITAFEALDGYKDSQEQIAKCNTAILDQKYDAAVKLYEDGEYEKAMNAFEALAGYKDSKEQIAKCKTAINDAKYNAAVELYNAGKYDEAIAAFEALDGYRDSADKAGECLYLKQKAGLTNVTVGSTIKFGFYEQDNNTSNGKEEIAWKVLAVEGNKALIISQFALDCQRYNTSYTSVTWEKCMLRTWLNGTFYNNAFGTDHQKMIASSTVTADKNPSYSTSPGNNTTDNVFLLSITEVNKYFSSDEARKCAPTDYAIARGAYTSDSYTRGGRATCWWWLRSPGYNSNNAANVLNDGSVGDYGHFVDRDDGAVRPAMWIDIGSLNVSD